MTTGLYPEAEANRLFWPRDDPRELVRELVSPEPNEPNPEVRLERPLRLPRDPRLNPEEPEEEGAEYPDPTPKLP